MLHILQRNCSERLRFAKKKAYSYRYSIIDSHTLIVYSHLSCHISTLNSVVVFASAHHYHFPNLNQICPEKYVCAVYRGVRRRKASDFNCRLICAKVDVIGRLIGGIFSAKWPATRVGNEPNITIKIRMNRTRRQFDEVQIGMPRENFKRIDI